MPAAADAAGHRSMLDDAGLSDALDKHLRVQQELEGGAYILVHKVGDLYYTGSLVRPGYTTIIAKERTLAVLLTTLRGGASSEGGR
jgi:hypothetical protein